MTEEKKVWICSQIFLPEDHREYAMTVKNLVSIRMESKSPVWSWKDKWNTSFAADDISDRHCWPRSRRVSSSWKWPQDETNTTRIKGTLKLEEAGDEVQRYRVWKNQGEPCDPYQRLKGQNAKGKVKVEALTTHFYSFPLHVHNSIEEVNLNSVAIEQNPK